MLMYQTCPKEDSHIIKGELKRHIVSNNLLVLNSKQYKEAKEKAIPEHIQRLISHTSFLQFPQSISMISTLLKCISAPHSTHIACE